MKFEVPGSDSHSDVKGKLKEAYFCSAYYELHISRRSGMARVVNKGSHSYTRLSRRSRRQNDDHGCTF